MLPKANRLTVFFHSQNVVSGPELRLFFRENHLPRSRFGISLKAGVLKKAVQRNRCKRLIRDWLRVRLSRLRTGFDVWILITSGAEENLSSSRFLDQTMTSIFDRCNFFISH